MGQRTFPLEPVPKAPDDPPGWIGLYASPPPPQPMALWKVYAWLWIAFDIGLVILMLLERFIVR